MLSTFDWIRLGRTGAELLATLDYFKDQAAAAPQALAELKVLGPPISLFEQPCNRCWIHPCEDTGDSPYCAVCDAILARAEQLKPRIYKTVVLWGYVDRLPWHLTGQGRLSGGERLSGAYAHDEHHFLLTMDRYMLKDWLRELLMYHGPGIKGLIQVFPTTGATPKGRMEEVLLRAMHLDTLYPLDMLRVRFYSNSYQLFSAHARDRRGMLTFGVRDFLDLLEMATIYRSLLKPDEQELLHKLTTLDNPSEKSFFWGRLAGYLSPKAKDMLDAWNFRQWPRERVKLLYELLIYAEYTH